MAYTNILVKLNKRNVQAHNRRVNTAYLNMLRAYSLHQQHKAALVYYTSARQYYHHMRAQQP